MARRRMKGVHKGGQCSNPSRQEGALSQPRFAEAKCFRRPTFYQIFVKHLKLE